MQQERSPTMTVPELAARMGIDQSTAWRYLRAGKLPGVQVASRWLIDRDRVERFMAGKEDASGNPLVADEQSSAAMSPVLELVPRLGKSDTDEAVNWLRGLMAVLELFATKVEATAERDAPRRLEA